jgi:hypothetical protein
MPALLEIDPARITKDNIPYVLGAIVVELRAINEKIDNGINKDHEETEKINNRLLTVEETLACHEKYFWGPIKLSRCQIIPFLKRNKYAVIATFSIATSWLAAVDYLVRAAQWAMNPPFKLQ